MKSEVKHMLKMLNGILSFIILFNDFLIISLAKLQPSQVPKKIALIYMSDLRRQELSTFV